MQQRAEMRRAAGVGRQVSSSQMGTRSSVELVVVSLTKASLNKSARRGEGAQQKLEAGGGSRPGQVARCLQLLIRRFLRSGNMVSIVPTYHGVYHEPCRRSPEARPLLIVAALIHP